MKITAIDIRLEDLGYFILELAENDATKHTVRGRFSMMALNRFCEAKDLTYLQLIGKITFGMKIGEYAELVLYALQDMYRYDKSQCRINGEEWTVEKVMDYVLEPMELGNDKALAFFKHAIGRVAKIAEEIPTQPEDDKKKDGQTESH